VVISNIRRNEMVAGFTNTNVRFNAKLAERNEQREANGEKPFDCSQMLRSVIAKLATDKPLWDFIGVKTNSCSVTEFVVEGSNGERLGEIGFDWHGRNYCVYVRNKRITDKLSRSDRYKTTDTDKAVLKVKKMFGSMSTNERISVAAAKASEVTNQASNHKWAQIREVEAKIERVANQYVKEEGYETFIAWLKGHSSQKAKETLEGIDNKVRLGIEMLTIQKVRDHFNEGKAVLVIKDGGKYIVKVGDKVDLYDDNTLPQEMRGKLGMLKLVEAEQFVTDTGCRINDETFILILEEVQHEG
jgi:hypothetical protein